MKKQKVKKLKLLVDELDSINKNIKQIKMLASYVVSQQCQVDFAFSIKVDKKEKKKVSFDEDGSLENNSSGFYVMSFGSSKPEEEKFTTETLNLDIDPDFSLEILQTIINRAEKRKRIIKNKLS